MKKVSALLCVLLLLVALVGCGNQAAPAASVSTAQETAEIETASENANDTSVPEEQQEATVSSEEADSSNDTPSMPQLEDFAGEYVGKYISFGENMIPLNEDEYYTLTIAGSEAIISEGIVTGTNGPGTMTISLEYENGELYWQPDDGDVRVFTLRMTENGSVTITFEVNPDIPVFHFDPVE